MVLTCVVYFLSGDEPKPICSCYITIKPNYIKHGIFNPPLDAGELPISIICLICSQNDIGDNILYYTDTEVSMN